MAEMHCFYTSTPDKGRNFIAIYGDGSQVDAYAHTESGFKDSGGDSRPDANWFADAGYLFFISLPENFKLWFQK